jgi:hypothetical protein
LLAKTQSHNRRVDVEAGYLGKVRDRRLSSYGVTHESLSDLC